MILSLHISINASTTVSCKTLIAELVRRQSNPYNTVAEHVAKLTNLVNYCIIKTD